jgi:hypothetical protein
MDHPRMTESDSPRRAAIVQPAGLLSDEDLLKLNRRWYAEVRKQAETGTTPAIASESENAQRAQQPDALSDEELRRLNRRWYSELSKVHAQEGTEFLDWLRAYNARRSTA